MIDHDCYQQSRKKNNTMLALYNFFIDLSKSDKDITLFEIIERDLTRCSELELIHLKDALFQLIIMVELRLKAVEDAKWNER